MPRSLVKRVFPDGFPITPGDDGRADGARTAAGHADLGATWPHSSIAEGGRTSVCVCDAPSPEAVRRTAAHSHWPAGSLTQVTVPGPHFHLASPGRPQRRAK